MATCKPHRRGCHPFRPLVLLVVAVFCLSGCGLAAAQAAEPPTEPWPYDVIPVEPELTKHRLKVMRILLSGRFADDQERELFDRYYTRYELARWTQKEYLTTLPGFRKGLRNNLRTAGTGGRPRDVHDHLSALLLRALGVLSGSNYHPATRYNAMLMIGELNADEGGAGELPTPLEGGLNFLVATLQNPQQPDAVKVAAVVGINRHAKLGGIETPQTQRLVLPVVYQLATAKNDPNRSPDGHAWMRARAAEVLGEIGALGNGGAVPKALAQMAADSGLPFSTRCAAAQAMGKLSYQGATGLNPSQLARPLGQLALDACMAELGAEILSRRQLKDRLNSASIGLSAIAPLASGPPHQAFVAALRQAIAALMTAIGDTKVDDDELLIQIDQTRASLEKVLKPTP